MASSSPQKEGDSGRPCYHASETPHFFKIVLSHTLKQGKLEIPKRFVREHGEGLINHDEAYLKVFGSEKWNVGLTSDSNGRIWFQKGWKEFVEFYSIGLGYFVVFEYKGHSCFYVVIFDQSASEIKYPVNKVTQRREEKEVEDEDDDVQIMDIISFECKRKNDDIKALCFLPDNKNVKTSQNCTSMQKIREVKMERYQKIQSFECMKKESKDLEVGDGSSDLKTMKAENRCRKKQQTNPRQLERVIESATAFKLKALNPCFIIKMWPSYIYPGNQVNIPRSFTELDIMEQKDIILQVADGRIWSVRCSVYLNGKKKRMRFTGGWRLFADDNNLQADDVSTFELIESSRLILLKVTIFRLSSCSS